MENMNIDHELEYCIKSITDFAKTNDLNQIESFIKQNELGLAFEWICAVIIENGPPVTIKFKNRLLRLFNYLNEAKDNRWKEIKLEEKINSIKIIK